MDILDLAERFSAFLLWALGSTAVVVEGLDDFKLMNLQMGCRKLAYMTEAQLLEARSQQQQTDFANIGQNSKIILCPQLYVPWSSYAARLRNAEFLEQYLYSYSKDVDLSKNRSNSMDVTESSENFAISSSAFEKTSTISPIHLWDASSTYILRFLQ